MFLYAFCIMHETFTKKTIYIPIATIVAALINIGLNYILIPHYEIAGAAYAMLISCFILLLLHYVFANYAIGGFPINGQRIFLPAVVVIAFLLLVNISINNTIIRFISVGICLCVFTFRLIQHYKKSDLL